MLFTEQTSRCAPVGQASAQCRILFPPPGLRINRWGGPPGPHGTPSSRPCGKNQSAATTEKPTRGSAADEGVRPTTCAIVRKREKLGALGFSRLQPSLWRTSVRLPQVGLKPAAD
jgi:hypothetical protein